MRENTEPTCGVVLDVGDVLIETFPMRHYQLLSAEIGLPLDDTKSRIENSGIVASFERGVLNRSQFLTKISEITEMNHLDDFRSVIERAWCEVLGSLDIQLVRVARFLCARRQLILASNTNSLHWAVISRLLADHAVRCPTALSYVIGACKPEANFFHYLDALVPSTWERVLFIDDSVQNVNEARRRGMTAEQHLTHSGTVSLIRTFVGAKPL